MIPLPEKRIVSLAFSPDSLRFAVAEGGAAIALCDSASLRVLRRFELPAPCLVTFSPDGRTLASAHAGGCIALWNAHGPPAPARSVDARRAWGDLVSASTPRALRACLDLASQGNEAVRYLANVMTEMPPGEDAGRLVDLLASPDASTRALAMSDLSYQGVIVHRTLQERLKAAPDDAQRAAIEDLLRAPWGTESPSPETRRRAWAVRALEHIGTPASLDLLRTVERSSPSDAERRMVREAADRLEKALSR